MGESRSGSRGRVVFWLGLCLAAVVACGDSSGDGDPPGEGSAELADSAVVLDEDAIGALIRVDSNGDYTFAEVTPVLSELDMGDVFIAGVSTATPMGALRHVDGVDSMGDGLVVHTSQATLQEAFKELDVTVATEVTPLAAQLRDRGDDGLSVPIDLHAAGADGSASLTGAVSLAPRFDLSIDIDIAEFSLDELSMEFGADETLLANLAGTGSASFDESVTLATIPFAPITLFLPSPSGIVPLVLTPEVKLRAGLQGSVAGDVTANVTQDASFTAGVGYHDGSFGGFSNSHSDFQFDPPAYDAGLSVRAWAGPRLSVLLYGQVGPYASAEGYLQAGADVTGPPLCVSGVLDGGLTARAGVDFIADFETVLFNKDFPLARYDSCDVGPDAPRPTVTWARSLGRDGSPGDSARAVAQAPDGSFLIIGDSDLYGGITGSRAGLWAVRVDPVGNVLWQRAYAGSTFGGGARDAVATDDGFIVATGTELMAMDAGGNPRWTRSYSSGEYLDIQALAAAPEGDLIVAGIYGNTQTAWAARLGSDGEVRWSRTFAGQAFNGAASTADGGAVLAGTTNSSDGDAYVVKLSASGSIDWQVAIDDRYDVNGGDGDPIIESGTDSGMDVAPLPGGGYVVVGSSYGAFPNPEPDPAGHYEAWVVELSAAGDLVASTVHRAPDDAVNDMVQAVEVGTGGGVVVMGRQANQPADMFESEDLLVIQGDAYSVLGGPDNDTLNPDSGGVGQAALTATQDGGFLVAATSNSFGDGDQMWMIKLSPTASISMPYFTHPTGSSHDNTDTVVASIAIDPVDVPVTGTPVTSDVAFETTAVSGTWQAP